MLRTHGTNMLDMRSAMAWIDGFDICASSTSLTILQSTESTPVLVAQMTT